MKRIRFIVLLSLTLLATSCESVLIREPAVTPRSTFEDLWKQMQERYPHFEIKGVDWEQVYREYSPQIKDNMSQSELFNVLGKMLGEIHDGHVNLMSSFDISHSPTINESLLGNRNVVESVLYEEYLTYTYHTTGGFIHNAIHNGKVGYLLYSSWMNEIRKSDLAYLYSKYSDCNGLILDLRSNTGGALYNLRMFLQSLPSNGQLLYTTKVKTGPGYEDFSEATGAYAPKTWDGPVWRKPLVVLIGPRSYSCSSLFSLCMKSYDNVRLVGNTTSGGTSVVYTFGLNNGWAYRTPMSRTFSPDGHNYENGVPPDYFVELDPLVLMDGKDSIIEFACRLIDSTVRQK